ncbi:MAG: hypothetical protein J6A47_00505 [Bacilli bacterium]|nr:hypothetical protein [Bacilli bacterium]
MYEKSDEQSREDNNAHMCDSLSFRVEIGIEVKRDDEGFDTKIKDFLRRFSMIPACDIPSLKINYL